MAHDKRKRLDDTRIPDVAYLVLGYVGNYPDGVHGYSLGRILARSRLGLPCLRLGQLYRVLHQLHGVGFVKGHVDGDGPRPPRHRFSMTAAGRAAFSKWLLSLPDGDGALTEAVLNRLRFSDRLPAGAIRGLLDKAMWRCDVALNDLRCREGATRDSGVRPTSLHFLATEARLAAERSWLNEVRVLIEGLPATLPAVSMTA